MPLEVGPESGVVDDSVRGARVESAKTQGNSRFLEAKGGSLELDPLEVEQALAGDREAFQRLVEETWGLVFVFIQQRLSDTEKARDLTQDTFLQAYDKRATLRDAKSFISWLLTIARRKVIDAHRRRASHPESPLTAAASADLRDSLPEPSHDLETAEASRKLQSALAQLDDRYRAVMTLRYWSGLTPAQIARLLGEPEGTIRNRIFRAHERLRKLLEGMSSRPATDKSPSSPTATPLRPNSSPSQRRSHKRSTGENAEEAS